jgi:hypothetical protein
VLPDSVSLKCYFNLMQRTELGSLVRLSRMVPLTPTSIDAITIYSPSIWKISPQRFMYLNNLGF